MFGMETMTLSAEGNRRCPPPLPSYDARGPAPSTVTMRAMVDDPISVVTELPSAPRGSSLRELEDEKLDCSPRQAVVENPGLAPVFSDLERISGFLGAALVDVGRDDVSTRESGFVDIKLAASSSAEVLAQEMKLLEQLDLGGSLEEIVVVVGTWLCILRPLDPQRFLYVIVDKDAGNLAKTRRSVVRAAAKLSV